MTPALSFIIDGPRGRRLLLMALLACAAMGPGTFSIFAQDGSSARSSGSASGSASGSVIKSGGSFRAGSASRSGAVEGSRTWTTGDREGGMVYQRIYPEGREGDRGEWVRDGDRNVWRQRPPTLDTWGRQHVPTPSPVRDPYADDRLRHSGSAYDYRLGRAADDYRRDQLYRGHSYDSYYGGYAGYPDISYYNFRDGDSFFYSRYYPSSAEYVEEREGRTWIEGHYEELPFRDEIEGEYVEVYHPAVYRIEADGDRVKLEEARITREPKVRIILQRVWVEGHYADEEPRIYRTRP